MGIKRNKKKLKRQNWYTISLTQTIVPIFKIWYIDEKRHDINQTFLQIETILVVNVNEKGTFIHSFFVQQSVLAYNEIKISYMIMPNNTLN